MFYFLLFHAITFLKSIHVATCQYPSFGNILLPHMHIPHYTSLLLVNSGITSNSSPYKNTRRPSPYTSPCARLRELQESITKMRPVGHKINSQSISLNTVDCPLNDGIKYILPPAVLCSHPPPRVKKIQLFNNIHF